MYFFVADLRLFFPTSHDSSIAPAAPDTKVDVVLIDGGVSGLIAAREAARKGCNTTLLEATLDLVAVVSGADKGAGDIAF